MSYRKVKEIMFDREEKLIYLSQQLIILVYRLVKLSITFPQLVFRLITVFRIIINEICLVF